MENNFNELKKLFEREVLALEEETQDTRDAIAYNFIRLLEGHSVREAERILSRASSLVGRTNLVKPIRLSQVEQRLG